MARNKYDDEEVFDSLNDENAATVASSNENDCVSIQKKWEQTKIEEMESTLKRLATVESELAELKERVKKDVNDTKDMLNTIEELNRIIEFFKRRIQEDVAHVSYKVSEESLNKMAEVLDQKTMAVVERIIGILENVVKETQESVKNSIENLQAQVKSQEEYTKAVQTSMEKKIAESENKGNGVFVTWKTVCYFLGLLMVSMMWAIKDIIECLQTNTNKVFVVAFVAVIFSKLIGELCKVVLRFSKGQK